MCVGSNPILTNFIFLFDRLRIFGNNSIMKHKQTIEKYDGTLEELVEDIGNLQYDVLFNFLTLFSIKLFKDSFADLKRDRPKLSGYLYLAGSKLYDSSIAIYNACGICKKYFN